MASSRRLWVASLGSTVITPGLPVTVQGLSTIQAIFDRDGWISSPPYYLSLYDTYWGPDLSQERISGECAARYFGGNLGGRDIMKRSGPGSEANAGDGNDAAWVAPYPLISHPNVIGAQRYQIIGITRSLDALMS